MVRRGVPRRFQFLLLLVAGLTVLLFLTTFPQNSPSSSLLTHPYFRFDFTAEETDVDPSQTCFIPRIHPFDSSIWRYITTTRPILCKTRIPALTYVDRYGWLHVNSTALQEAGYCLNNGLFINVLKCSWRAILRGGHDQTDDDTVGYGEEHPLSENGVSVLENEVVVTTCRNFAGIPVYENIHAHIRNVTFRHRHSPTKNAIHNVLIFGLDSMSRQAFIRHLPQTYRYLTRSLSAHVFTGMNKIGDNTFPNLVALLTGKAAYGPSLTNISEFDDWPLIWNDYSRKGYVTLWAEDFPDYGLFNYLDKGFRKPPVHHYLRPFWLAVKNSATLRSSSHMCFGNEPRHQLQLDYLLRFILKYNSNKNSSESSRRPYFGFSFLGELSHEYISQVGSADQDFETFFRFLHEGHYLDNTLLVVMSDHGHRFDAIRSTQIGRLEERLPFFAMYLPPKFAKENWQAMHQLEANRGRLITPYDAYATLSDFLEYASDNRPLGRSGHDRPSGRTLFGPIPATRTCTDAEIPPHYCTCEPEVTISVDDLRVRVAVRVLFNRVNRMLRTVREFCVDLQPGDVFNAQVINTADHKGIKDRIRVTVAAAPSDAILEATVEVRTREKPLTKSKNYSPYDAVVLGDVSRINRYGNQSSCIKHDILRKYCYCQKRTPLPSNKLQSYQEQRRQRRS